MDGEHLARIVILFATMIFFVLYIAWPSPHGTCQPILTPLPNPPVPLQPPPTGHLSDPRDVKWKYLPRKNR